MQIHGTWTSAGREANCVMNLDGRIDFQSLAPNRALPKCFLMLAKWASSGLSPQKHDPAFYTDKY